MASPFAVFHSGEWRQWIFDFPIRFLIPYLATAFVVIFIAYSFSLPDPNPRSLPRVNSPTSFFGVEAKRAFMTSAKRLLNDARLMYPGQPYKITTELGEIVILPSDFADEVGGIPDLNFAKAFDVDFHGHIPGFTPVALPNRGNQILQIVARKYLTRSLPKVLKPLSGEVAYALSTQLGEGSEWRGVAIHETLLNTVARLSTRVFLGEELCCNEDWLRVTAQYTIQLFIAAAELRMWPRPVRGLVHWFLPECKRLRDLFYEAGRILGPVIQKRHEAKQAAINSSQPVPEYNDTLDWADKESDNQPYDRVAFQLILSMVAINTTTDLLEQCVLDLAQHPETFQPLRDEIGQALRDSGLQTTSLQNMKLLDSVIKESQRMKPISIVSMRRYAENNVRLSNGLVFKRGSRLNVDSYRMWDPDLHENPNQWDGNRFLKLRLQPGKEKMAQLVATSADHLAFGHGDQACPGRFFAAAEIKIVLCHLLIKYDWKLAPGTDTEPEQMGTLINANRKARILFRRREKTDLDFNLL